MSDSSSDDDDVKKLLDSVDTEFINDDMFTGKKNEDVTTEVEKPSSLRYSEENTEQFSSLGVTPEFQKFVARHLSEMLDKRLKEVTPKKLNKALPKEEENHFGIHLLSTSIDYVCLEESDVEKVKIFNNVNRRNCFKSKKRKLADEENQSSDSEEEDKRTKVAAVSPEWVLNKEGIQGWVRTAKSELIQGEQSRDCNNGGDVVGVVNGEVKKKKKKKKKKKDSCSVTEVINN